MRLSPRLSALVAAIVAIAPTNCRDPSQYGGPIPVYNDGLSGRLALLCRAGMNERAQRGCPDDVVDSGMQDTLDEMDEEDVREFAVPR